VSNLRNESANLKCEVEDKNKLIVNLEKRVVETNRTLKALQLVVDCNCRGNKEVTSVGSRVTSKDNDWSVAPSAGRTKKRYSDLVADRPGMCLFIIKCTNFLLNPEIIKVQNTPRPYLSQK